MTELADGTNRALEIHRHGDNWSALYVDGVLHSQQHDVTEIVLDMIGITIVDSPAFMRGGHGKSTAPTLADIETYATERDRHLSQARTLRTEANMRIAQAARIEDQYK